MRTIRQNVFETNSSSSHSVTITNKNKFIPLVIDGVLNAGRLSDYDHTDFYYSESRVTVCDTKDKKAALVANWIRNASKYDISEEKYQEYISYLTEKLGYKEIVDTVDYYEYYSESDTVLEINEENYLDTIITKSSLDEAIELILNDDVILTDVKDGNG